MVTIHVIAPFHSRLVKEHWSHCAFTQITLKQIEIFKSLGFQVIDYSNYGSESVADEKVVILQKETFDKLFSDDGLPGHDAIIGSAGWTTWYAQLEIEVKKRTSQPGMHIIAHSFADAAGQLVQSIPNAIHFEPHIGYDRAPFGAKRVYVSQAWRHFLWGKYPNDTGDRRYSWVVLPYYNEKDWPFVPAPQDYIAYMGRITPDKGITTIGAIAEAKPDWKFKVAGSGNFAQFNLPTNVEYMGILPGKDRAAFLGNARVLLCPSEYVEPCAGVVCEAAMTGTPTVASSWGGYTETIEVDKSGYTASTLKQWVDRIEESQYLGRARIFRSATERFSLTAARYRYAMIIEQLLSMRTAKGWYYGV